jgi:hypothetical protein
MSMQLEYGFLKPEPINPLIGIETYSSSYFWSFDSTLPTLKRWEGSVSIRDIMRELGYGGWIFCGKDGTTYCFYRRLP